MNRKTFMGQLREGLKMLPGKDRNEILYDYEEHFTIGSENGKTEEEISISLGNPIILAKEFSANYMIDKAEEKMSTTSIFSAVFATLSLGLFNLIFVLGPFIAIWVVVIALFLIAFGVSLSGVALFFGSLLGFWGLLSLPFIIKLGAVFLSIGMLALGILFCIGHYYLAKVLFRLTINYLKFNLKIITGKERRLKNENTA